MTARASHCALTAHTPAVDDAFNFSGRPETVREAFERFPPERRERIAARAIFDPRCEHVARLLEFPKLAPVAAKRLKKLSTGSREYEPLVRIDDPLFFEHIQPYEQLRRLYHTPTAD